MSERPEEQASTASDATVDLPVALESGGRPTEMHGRLHPSVIALWSVRGIAPLGALWLAGSVQRYVAVAIVVVILGSSWVRWLRFEWRIGADGLVIEHGLLQRTRRVMPLERIQAVQTVRKVRHRVFGVVGLRIEAVGGSDTEGQLDALTLDTARRIQRVLLRHSEPLLSTASVDGARWGDAADPGGDRAGPDGSAVDAGPPSRDPPGTAIARAEGLEAPAGQVLARCTPRMLLVAGLTGGRVGVAAALLAFAQEFIGERATEAVVSAPQRFGVTVLVLLIVLGAVIAFVLSVAATAVTYWDFTVRRDGGLVRLHRGLLDERRDTVPVARIQSLTVEENIVRRPLGLATVKMTVAGRAGDDGVTSTLLPIATRVEAFDLAGQLFDVGGLAGLELTPMPEGARRRRLARGVVIPALVTAVALAVAPWPYGVLGVLLAGVTIPAALASYRALGWRRHRATVVSRSGWLVRRTGITPELATQSARVSASPFQRRRDLATLRIEIARTRAGRDPRLLDLYQADADAVQLALADAAAPSTAGS